MNKEEKKSKQYDILINGKPLTSEELKGDLLYNEEEIYKYIAEALSTASDNLFGIIPQSKNKNKWKRKKR